MRSDAKLGLALGMLVIGFAIAFCFPRQGRVSRVAEFQKPTLSVDEPDIEFVQLRSLREEGNHFEEVERLQQLNHLAQSQLPTDSDLVSGSSDSTTRELTTDISAQSGLSDLLFPDEFKNEGETETFAPVLPESTGNVDSETTTTTYRVQAGDTLSGISMKTLGSYSRYLDIYAANRDQLSSPDDLPLGMELHIPLPHSGAARLAEETMDKERESLSKPGDLDLESTIPQRFHGTQGAPFLSDRTVDVPVVHQIQSKNVTSHVVRSGDTLETVAVRYFGTTRAVEQLRKANPELTRNPQRLRPGVILQLVP